jgi:tetratricopeptide (TPR) repeat protein
MRRLGLVLLLVAAPAAAGGGSILDDPVFVVAVDRGLARLYDLDAGGARAAFAEARRRYPDHPAVELLDALPGWWAVQLDPDDRSRLPAVEAAMGRVLARAERRLAADPTDADGRFFKAAALGFRGRLRSLAGDWIPAAWDGKRALDLVRDLQAEQPRNADLAFGLGLYDYYAAVIPDEYPVFKPLRPFFPHADRGRGVRLLEQVMADGRFARTESAYYLLLIHLYFEEDYARALRYAAWLRREHPGNALFHVYEARALAGAGQWERVAAVCEEVLARQRQGRPGYDGPQVEVALYHLGRSLLERGRFREALVPLQRLESLAAGRGRRGGFRTLGQLRQGMARDALGERAAAVAHYRRALDLADTSQAHRRARDYLGRPFAPAARPVAAAARAAAP